MTLLLLKRSNHLMAADDNLPINIGVSTPQPSPLGGEGWGVGYSFEDLRSELVSRKYSYKTIKGYLYYNKDFINHVRKDRRQDIHKCLRQSGDKEGCFITCPSAQFCHAPFGRRNRSALYSGTLGSLPQQND